MLNWNRSIWRSMAAVCAAVLLAATAVAAEEPASAEAPSPAEIATLVEQLDADSFAERQAATDKLGEIGKPAVAALGQAALGDSLEVIVRAIDILKDLMDSDDTVTQEAARAALERVSESDRAAAARRAADALKEDEAKRNAAANQFRGRIQIAGAAINGARKISVRTVNGVKTIEAEEADQKIKITDDPKAGIKMEVTSKKDGKDVTEKYEAKNAEELKKKHLEAYKIYAKYKQVGGANIALQVQAGNVQIARQIRRPNPIDNVGRILQSWGMALERMATEEAIRDASQESREELKKKVGEAREQLDKLEKRVQEAIEKAAAELAEEEAADEEN